MKSWIVLGLLAGAAQAAPVSVHDDAGHTITLAKPAQRVIALAPNITELLFAAGAGDKVVGVMNFSDYPEAAKTLPIIGSNASVDVERLLALKPDLLIVWQSGNTARQLEQLASLGLPIYYHEARKLEDIATSLTRFGQLTGTDAAAGKAAQAFRQQVATLGARYAQRAPVRVFYQIWDKPLYTLNGQHIVSDALAVCGGVNVFAGLPVLAPQVSTEAVLQQNPEAIIGGEPHDPADAGINIWRPYKSLQAVQRQNLFALGGERLTRATPRMAEGIAQICDKLDLARQRRQRAP